MHLGRHSSWDIEQPFRYIPQNFLEADVAARTAPCRMFVQTIRTTTIRRDKRWWLSAFVVSNDYRRQSTSNQPLLIIISSLHLCAHIVIVCLDKRRPESFHRAGFIAGNAYIHSDAYKWCNHIKSNYLTQELWGAVWAIDERVFSASANRVSISKVCSLIVRAHQPRGSSAISGHSWQQECDLVRIYKLYIPCAFVQWQPI